MYTEGDCVVNLPDRRCATSSDRVFDIVVCVLRISATCASRFRMRLPASKISESI